jgi:mRNA-degrading endonuclease toxin of MazEF toxin-antitoxin module
LRIRVAKGICGLQADSEVLVAQIEAWDNSLFRRELGLLPEALADRVRAALKDFLDI